MIKYHLRRLNDNVLKKIENSKVEKNPFTKEERFIVDIPSYDILENSYYCNIFEFDVRFMKILSKETNYRYSQKSMIMAQNEIQTVSIKE